LDETRLSWLPSIAGGQAADFDTNPGISSTISPYRPFVGVMLFTRKARLTGRRIDQDGASLADAKAASIDGEDLREAALRELHYEPGCRNHVLDRRRAPRRAEPTTAARIARKALRAARGQSQTWFLRASWA